jgi:DNA repair protein RecN (Recombination protein N)
MLNSLEIENFILIKKVSINFNSGFNAFTGETGAGKSIIIEGLKLVLGSKNYNNLQIEKNEISKITAVFDITEIIKKNLEKLDISFEDDYLIIQREINSDLKSKVFINGKLSSLSTVRELLNGTIEFQENFEQQELFDDIYFLNFIDKFANVEKKELNNYFVNYLKFKKEYENHIENEGQIKDKLDILKTKFNKIKSLNPKINEYEKLLNQRNLYKNNKKISDLTLEIKNIISNLNNHANLSELERSIQKISDLDDKFKNISDKLSSCILDLNEYINDIETEIEDYDFSDINFDEIEAKIYEYQNLSKFFDVDPNLLHNFLDQISDEINNLENFDIEKIKKEKLYKQSLNLFLDESKKISKIRKNETTNLTKKINSELPSLNIEQGEIKFEFNEKMEKDFSSNGIDKLDVLFRTSKKAQFSSIKKVASGGELSRLLLVIKSISTQLSKEGIIIFDEVDSGLSGRVAENVARKILELSKNNQVIAITHSAQVASKALKHWKITKNINNESLESKIIELSNEERVNEIASLISGNKITEDAKKVAFNLMQTP